MMWYAQYKPSKVLSVLVTMIYGPRRYLFDLKVPCTTYGFGGLVSIAKCRLCKTLVKTPLSLVVARRVHSRAKALCATSFSFTCRREAAADRRSKERKKGPRRSRSNGAALPRAVLCVSQSLNAKA